MSTPVPPPPPSSSDGPPPPPYGSQPPTASFPPSQPPPPPGYAPTPPGYGVPGAPPAVGFGAKPPRPDVRLGAILMVVGSLLSIIGVYLPWVSLDGESANGTATFITSDFTLIENPGAAVWVFAVITIGLGLALFFAGRVLAVAIIGIIAAAVALLVGIGMIGISTDQTDIVDGSSLGIGAILQPIAPLLTLAGAIVATSKRRRWPAGTAPSSIG